MRPSWQQVAVIVACLAAVILAHIFAPGASAGVVSSVSILVAWLTEPPKNPPVPPLGVVLLGVVALVGVNIACGPYMGPEQRRELVDHAHKIEACKDEARGMNADAGKDAGLAAFDKCMER